MGRRGWGWGGGEGWDDMCMCVCMCVVHESTVGKRLNHKFHQGVNISLHFSLPFFRSFQTFLLLTAMIITSHTLAFKTFINQPLCEDEHVCQVWKHHALQGHTIRCLV